MSAFPTPRAPRSRKAYALHTVLFVLTLVAAVWGLFQGAQAMGYRWQWYRVPELFIRDGGEGWNIGVLPKGLLITLIISGLSLVLALSIGLGAAVLARARGIIGPRIARVYVEIIRNTPILVQLYIFYYVLGPVFGFDRFWAAVLCLAFFEGAFAAEIFRAGMESVPRAQWEAARGLALSPYRVLKHAIIPQALRLMLPPFVNLAVNLVKHSSIVSVIAVAELTTAGRNVISSTFMSFEVWLTVAGIYLVITTALSFLASALENRWAKVGAR